MSRRGSQLGQGQSVDVSQHVIEEVADTLEKDPLELEPLNEQIDADALNKLFRRDFNGQIRFQYLGCTVVVDDEDSHCVSVSDFDAP